MLNKLLTDIIADLIADIRSRLEHAGIEKATVGRMLEDIECIVVHEWQLEIRFNPLRLMEITKKIR